MKKTISLIAMSFSMLFVSVANAKTPPEVLKPYKAYNVAHKANNHVEARKLAYEAWQKAEELMGDSPTTAALALNFAMNRDNESKKIVKEKDKAFKRALELTALESSPGLSYLERSVTYMGFRQVNFSKNSAYNVSKKIVEYAEANDLTKNTFYAEALTLQAGYHASRANHKSAEKVAEKALEAFSTSEDNYVTAQPILANLYKGYSLEGQQKPVEAALSYQKVMEAMDGINPDEHPLAAKALGRWSHMRAVLNSEGLLEEAEEKGLCECWPYDKPRNENVKPIKRVPPTMPRNAYVSGFTIVEFDLSDEGRPINTEVLVSWPEDIYKKASLDSLKRWEYTPRTEDETDSDRENIISTIRFQLTDKAGNIIY